MRRTLVWSLSAIFTLVLLAGSAMSAPSTVSYQGRLTNSSGTPVADGSYSVSFSLWTDSVGGTMIWSETQNVPVSGGGLFSTQLGNTQPLGGELVIHGGDDLYLQLALSGQALTPRMALGTVPRAFASSSLNTSTPNVGTLHASVGDDTTKITASHQSAMGVIDSYVHLTDDRALLGLKAYDPAQSQSSSSGSEVMGGTARNYLDHDDDGDAVPDIVEEFSAGDGSAKIGVKASKRRFNLLDAFPQSFRVVAHDSDTGSSVSMALETDADVDGVAESGIWEKVDNSEGLSIVGVDVDEDGIPDVGTSSSAKLPRSVLKTFFERGDKPTQSQIVDSVDENGATSGVIRYEGSDFEGFQVSLMPDSAVVSTEVSNPSGSSSSRMRTRINELESKLQSIGLLARTSSTSSLTPDSVSEITESQAATTKARRLVFVSGTTGAGSLIEVNSVDDDGDGTPEQEISSKIVPTRSQHAVNTKGTGAQNGRLVSITSGTSPDSAKQTISIDDNGDSNPESMAEATVSDKFAQVRGFKVEITGRTSSFGSVCDSNGASSSLTVDIDSDGHTDTDFDASVSDSHSVCKVAVGRILQNLANETAPSEKSAVFIASGDIDDDGISNTDVMMKITPTVAMHAVNTKGTGAQNGRVVSITSGTNVDSATFSVRHEDGGLGSAAVQITSSGIDSYIHLTDDGLTVLKLSSSSSSHPIEHSSGAHLTSGGVWTNASDENLKENFQPIDGAALLEKIDQLPISEWNYKIESDDVKHIGPTAQDFQKVFGIGENDKTISTIDPSGIALAAIKELNKQNQLLLEQGKELRDQNEQLRKEVNDLRALIEKVASRQ